MTFEGLHLAIQAAMGWQNYHLFSFRRPGNFFDTIGILSGEDFFDEDMEDAKKTKLKKHFTEEKQKMMYTYDFGDSWEHTVLLEKIGEENLLAPICIKGKGACPPEDCGGLWGYYDLVETVNAPKAKGKGEAREWLGLSRGEIWDVAHFDLEETNQRLQAAFH